MHKHESNKKESSMLTGEDLLFLCFLSDFVQYLEKQFEKQIASTPIHILNQIYNAKFAVRNINFSLSNIGLDNLKRNISYVGKAGAGLALATFFPQVNAGNVKFRFNGDTNNGVCKVWADNDGYYKDFFGEIKNNRICNATTDLDEIPVHYNTIFGCGDSITDATLECDATKALYELGVACMKKALASACKGANSAEDENLLEIGLSVGLGIGTPALCIVATIIACCIYCNKTSISNYLAINRAPASSNPKNTTSKEKDEESGEKEALVIPDTAPTTYGDGTELTEIKKDDPSPQPQTFVMK